MALASGSVLALQVVATRLFSFLIWYHFAFLVLSIAFLGFTAGGFAVAKLPATPDFDPRVWLSRLGGVAGVATLLCYAVLEFLPPAPHFAADAKAMYSFALLVLVVLVPFVCLGAYICLALSTWSDRIGLLYAVDLAGSALGCLLSVALLTWLGVPAAFFASGFMAFCAGLCNVVPRPGRHWTWFALGCTAMAWLALIAGATHELSAWVYIKTSKPFPNLPRELISAKKSDSLSSVEMFRFPFASLVTLWGMSSQYKDRIPEIVGFAIDGWALTATYKRADVEVPNSVLDYLPAALPYRVQPTRDALVIGAGGGLDVLTALHNGARHVTGVEINPIIIGAVQNEYADFAGHLYQDPRVEMHNAEGRHFLKRDKRKYDLIQLSGVDTYAASQAGAFALHENYLYTVEAMRDYFNALRPDGMVTFTRWLYVPPGQTVRLCAIADQALRDRGLPHPERHIAVFESNGFTVAMIKLSEYSRADIARIESAVTERGFRLLYAPYVRVNPLKELWGENPFYQLWDLGPARFIREYALDIRPTTDDRPFFFEYQRWGRESWFGSEALFRKQNAQVVLLETLAVCGGLCALILVLAFRRYRSLDARLGVAAHIYFVALGLGYIFVENVLVQRIILFLGSPVYALTVIMFALLAASGAGSALASRYAALQQRAPYAMLMAAGILVLYATCLRPVLDALLGLALPVRILIVLLLIAPLGIAMGMPFPVALDRLTRADARLVPWAWVINGAASVIGSILTVMLAMTVGFNAVFVCAALLYVTAAATFARIVRQP